MKIRMLAMSVLAGLALVATGCRDYDREEGTGGSGQVVPDESKLENKDEPIYDRSGVLYEDQDKEKELGDGKIGENEGVIDDGEGPLEGMGGSGEADDKIGDEPGVINDGEGPIEQTPLDRPEGE